MVVDSSREEPDHRELCWVMLSILDITEGYQEARVGF